MNPKKTPTAKGRSKKPQIFEWLFAKRYDFSTNEWAPRFDVVTNTIPEQFRLVFAEEITRANDVISAGLKHNQGASFSKDFLRNEACNTSWPQSLTAARWTISQITGKDPVTNRLRNFEWIPYTAEQIQPFPNKFPIPLDTADYDHYRVQSVSISVPSKQILRLDEARLMQIAVELRIVEAHFALHSPLNRVDFRVVHIDHLQTGMKQRRAEIDGLFLAQFQTPSATHPRLTPVLITVEAKMLRQSITSQQILTQIEEASALGVDCELIVPLAMKQQPGGIFIFEFAPFTASSIKPETLTSADLVLQRRSFYEIVPPVFGFGEYHVPSLRT